MQRLTAWLVAAGFMMVPLSVQAEPAPECRQYTKEHRVGPGAQNVYGLLCRQPDGTWRKVENPDVRARVGITYGEQTTQHQSSTHIYSTHPDAPTELLIQDNIPAYVVIDPYRYHAYPPGRNWHDRSRHHSGWDKHRRGQHHERGRGGRNR